MNSEELNKEIHIYSYLQLTYKLVLAYHKLIREYLNTVTEQLKFKYLNNEKNDKS